MGKARRKRRSTDAIQREIAELSADAERLCRRIQDLGEELDEPLSAAQAQGLEPESLRTHVASWLLTSDDSMLCDIAERLARLARLRQEDVERGWKARLPVTLAEEASHRLSGLSGAVRSVLDAATDGDRHALTAALEDLCGEMEADAPKIGDLAARCRRYLAGESEDETGGRRPPLPSTPHIPERS